MSLFLLIRKMCMLVYHQEKNSNNIIDHLIIINMPFPFGVIKISGICGCDF